MSDQTIFDYTFSVPYTAQISIDFSGAHSYSSFSGNSPWQISIYVDGVLNSARNGAGAITDVVSLMGLKAGASAGNHNIKVIWFGASGMTLSGSILRVIATMK